MDKQEIVAEFFKRGHLLTDEAIETLIGAGPENFLGKDLPLVVEAKDIRQQFRILKNITTRKSEITNEDFVRYFNSKYEKMKEIILTRAKKNFISLNKLDASRSEVHVIGIVRDVKEKDGKTVIDLEDPTGTAPVIFDSRPEDVELDDVVAVQAVSGGKVLFGKKIIWPDIPLRQPAIGNGKACFVSDFRLDEASTRDAERFFQWFSQSDIPFMFVAGDLGDRALFERYVDRYCYVKTVFVIAADDSAYPQIPFTFESARIVSLSNPALLEIGGLKVLIVHKGSVSNLKKRHLGRSNAILDEDFLALDEIPDIMHTGHAGEPFVTNYKSVTIVNSGSLLGSFKPIVIDFATRDVEKISLTSQL
ncbi:MAG: metallophosphoesterase family protein [Candidatus Aenigmarchaeota archaeon]|nr:metallophosphoesterase family protein [Candidatus Aenigmarchaeota archaeon]